ncbi:unnamed protein product [Meganyctiphanes norvegica]|uniref:PEHE domain-containing protein n=1 Tax=Meganyctiphanes norvegica TaxID=48144 RepID=A0AAV2PJW5_MEGNR
MAPALTQASDPQSLAPHHPSPDKITNNQSPSEKSEKSSPNRHLLTPLQYGGLKEPQNCTDIHLAAALAKGNCQIHCLLTPSLGVSGRGCGREGLAPPDKCPQINTIPSTMDPQLNVTNQVDASVSTPESSSIVEEETMGQNTIQQGNIAAHQSSHYRGQKSPKPNDGDLMSLIGRDFANMNEIIDTLAQWADNPEVMAAVNTAALNLPNSSTPSSQATPIATQSQPEISQPAKEEQAQRLLQDFGRRQWQLERRQARILRRLRRVTARGLGASVSGQLRELLHFSESALKEQKEQSNNGEHGVTISSPPEIGVEALRADAMRNMSTSALVNLVRRVEASQGLARLAAASHHRSPLQLETLACVVDPTLPEHVGREVATLVAEMRSAAQCHSHHDSDATESSSGGDSCDELEGYPQSNPFYTPVNDRAYYRYCRARSWVASRWTWLQAQVADLEYRILQQQKIYMHVRNSKGSVQLDESRSWKGPPPRDPAHLDHHDPALTCLSAPTMRTTLNGYHSRIDDSSHSDTTSFCSRTQGVKAVKRRRLVRAGAGVAPRRGGRIPPVPCKCGPPLSCVLCVKVTNQTSLNNVPDPDTQPAGERHARVDPTYHPVLSQQTDISLSECFDSILKTTDWQRQVLPSRSVHPLPSISHIRDNVSQDRKRKKDRKKECKKYKKDGKGRITLKLKKSLFTADINQEGELKKKRHPSQEHIMHYKKVQPLDDDEDSSVYGSSLQSSPSASPAPIDKSAAKKHGASMAPKNKQSSAYNSYDIDNIIIPYSMAASTRVEKLEYKEIPTPKWRLIPTIPNNIQTCPSRDEEDEDVSEEAVIERHNRSEELERKKFMQYLTLQVSSRTGRSRRTDSSGTNTPDHPLSPRPLDPASDNISPLATPPSTPLAPSEDSNQSSSLPTNSNLPVSFSIQNNSLQLDKFGLQNMNSNNQSSSSGNSAYFALQSSALSSLQLSQLGDVSKAVLLRRNRSMSYGARLRTSISSEDGLVERMEVCFCFMLTNHI